MAGWTPSNDFENEILALQPDCDLIFGNYEERETCYPRPEDHLKFAAEKGKNRQISRDKEQEEKHKFSDKQRKKFNAICKISEITKTKQMGEMPTINDWDTTETLEKETIALMRNMGLDPLIDQPFSEIRPSTYSTPKDYVIMKNGKKKMPIFMNEKYFSLKSKIPPSLPESLSDSEDSSSLSSSSHIDKNSTMSGMQYEKVPDLKVSSINSSSTESDSYRTDEWEGESTSSISRHRRQQTRKFFTPKELYQLKRKDE